MKTARTVPPAPRRPPLFWAALLLLPITIVPFFQLGGFDLIPVDDPGYIHNPFVSAGITLDGIRWAFVNADHAHWFPLTWISLMIDVELWGVDPGAMHLTNLALHAANALLLLLLLNRLTGSVFRAFLAAALFAIHPSQVESVAWVTERKDVLFVFFGLLTLIAYQQIVRLHLAAADGEAATGEADDHPGARNNGDPLLQVQSPSTLRARTLMVPLFGFSAAVMAKPMAVTLPVWLLLIDFWPLRRRIGPGLIVEKWPFWLLAAAGAGVTLYWAGLRGNMADLATVGIIDRLADACLFYARYLQHALWPTNLAFYYPHPTRFWSPLEVAFSATLLLMLSILAFRLRRKAPHLLFGWLWFLLILTPVIGIFQQAGQGMADRFSYLPLAGLFIAASWEAGRWLAPWARTPRRRWALIGAALAGLTLLGVQTWRQAALWSSPQALFTRSLESTGPNPTILRLLGIALANQGAWEQALERYRQSLTLLPTSALGHNLSGSALLHLGRPAEALAHLEQAIQHDGRRSPFYMNKGLALLALGRLAEALAAFDQAARIHPQPQLALDRAGQLLGEHGHLPEAATLFRRALEITPEAFPPRLHLAMALEETDPEAALPLFFLALEAKPDSGETLMRIGRTLNRLKRPVEALQALGQARQLGYESADLHAQFGVSLAKTGQIDQAAAHLKQALTLEPEHALSRQLLAVFEPAQMVNDATAPFSRVPSPQSP